MKKEIWKTIGYVGVDSGQLMICDPCYIGSEWKDNKFKGESRVVEIKTGKKLNILNWNDEYEKGITFNQAMDRKLIKEIPYEETSEFSYDGCCKATINKSFGQLNYKMGHEGAGVVFSPGYGDGTYEVCAKFKDYGKNLGKRIKEVKIILIEG